jgi:hypothetical protein
MGKTALINIDDGLGCFFLFIDPVAKGHTFGGIRLWMAQRFFICHAKLAQGLPDRFWRDRKPRRTVVLVSVRKILDIFYQRRKINLARPVLPCLLWTKRFIPAG